MRYLDILSDTSSSSNQSNEITEDTRRVLSHTLDERTKKGGRVAWSSPVFGDRSGRLLMAPGVGWVLVQSEHAPDLLVWVWEGLYEARDV